MASIVSTGSPKLGKKSPSAFKILDQGDESEQGTPKGVAGFKPGQPSSSASTPTPLQSSKLGNLQPKTEDTTQRRVETSQQDKMSGSPNIDDILARLRLNGRQQSSSPQATILPTKVNAKTETMDKLLANLTDQGQALKKQELDLKDGSDSDGHKEEDRSSGSELFTPATDTFDVTSAGIPEAVTARVDHAQMLRVQQELAAAKSLIERQNQELADARNLKHTMDQAMSPPSEADFGSRPDISEQTISNLQNAFNASARPFNTRNGGWLPQEDQRTDESDVMSAGAYSRGRGVWNNPVHGSFGSAFNSPPTQPAMYNDPRTIQNQGRSWNGVYGSQPIADQGTFPGGQRMFSGSSASSYGFDGRFGGEHPQLNHAGGVRRAMNPYGRPSSAFSNRSANFGNYAGGFAGLSPASISPISIPGPMSYQPRPIGTPLSPTASEFTSSSFTSLSGPWSPMSSASGSTYVTPLEPMNYRRLLDKSVSCDWKYIVDKIVCSNDQQASIFLQQKLKVGTAEQKYEIVEAIVNQAYPLMINRFGNFLVQRCFEHGTPDQVVAIANAIHGNVLSLSMDAFGCHVIQKAFDSVPEQHKADMVRELLRRIPDTVIHRYACHVWQKLFELRWSGEPPQIMLKVNEALHGMWHEVALGETGSLVVQNIFENCVEEEKRPAIEEVIASIDLIAHGQFGNWCIQHLCEHGSPPDKRRVIDHILANAYSYSIDQFASKVVEKCLKIGGVDFMDRYLGVITTAHPDRPRIPLIDIAGDQYGNYLIQWILMNTHHHQREQVAIHIRKHMVSLRGSKFGSRVAMLCCNPASVTRPGPGVIVNPFGAPGQPRGWGRYR